MELQGLVAAQAVEGYDSAVPSKGKPAAVRANSDAPSSDYRDIIVGHVIEQLPCFNAGANLNSHSSVFAHCVLREELEVLEVMCPDAERSSAD